MVIYEAVWGWLSSEQERAARPSHLSSHHRAVSVTAEQSGVSAGRVSALSKQMGWGQGHLPDDQLILGLPVTLPLSAFLFLSEETHSAPQTAFGPLLILLVYF